MCQVAGGRYTGSLNIHIIINHNIVPAIGYIVMYNATCKSRLSLISVFKTFMFHMSDLSHTAVLPSWHHTHIARVQCSFRTHSQGTSHSGHKEGPSTHNDTWSDRVNMLLWPSSHSLFTVCPDYRCCCCYGITSLHFDRMLYLLLHFWEHLSALHLHWQVSTIQDVRSVI